MSWLLFPGRHLVNTTFQERYLKQLASSSLDDAPGLILSAKKISSPLEGIIFAITSSNQANSRYNPIPFHQRAIGVDRFARSLSDELNWKCRIFGIPHYGHTKSFADFTLKEIRDQSEGELNLKPENTLVLCSTPEVIRLYQELGFSNATAEQTEPEILTPIQCIQEVGQKGLAWHESSKLREHLAPATQSLLNECPDIPRRVARLYQDPLANQEGSLTPTRNYNSYARGMNEIIRLKYEDIKEVIRPGRIADEGCADGALLAEVAQTFPDSDLYGIDLSAEFAHRFQERQRSGDFGGAYVHFYQRNLQHPIFDPDSVDTVICNSTLHELWSYGDGESTIRAYLAEKWKQLRTGGRLIIRDVVGPDCGNQNVLLWCNTDDGKGLEGIGKERDTQKLNELSTWSRFKLFTEDFLSKKQERAGELKQFEVVDEANGRVQTSLQLAMEFCTKKDYTDNWSSEMNEEFCFWSINDWKKALRDTGFQIVENTTHSQLGSRTYRNEWIIKNRYLEKVSLSSQGAGGSSIEFPATNMVLVAEKPRK